MSAAVPALLLPSRRFKNRSTALGIAAFAGLSLCWAIGFNPWLLVSEFPHVARLAADMVPPKLSILWSTSSLLSSVGSTLAMAFLGTLIGGMCAMIMAFFAAENVMRSAWTRQSVRGFMALHRVMPTFVSLLVLQCMFGMGPFSGMLAIAMGSYGMFGRLFADTIEQVEKAPLEALISSGATRSQMVRYGVLPQVVPSFVANMFFAFDINMRVAVALGIFGGGGLGYELHKAGKTLQYKEQLALILIIVALIALMEKASDALRIRLLGNQGLQ